MIDLILNMVNQAFEQESSRVVQSSALSSRWVENLAAMASSEEHDSQKACVLNAKVLAKQEASFLLNLS